MLAGEIGIGAGEIGAALLAADNQGGSWQALGEGGAERGVGVRREVVGGEAPGGLGGGTVAELGQDVAPDELEFRAVGVTRGDGGEGAAIAGTDGGQREETKELGVGRLQGNGFGENRGGGLPLPGSEVGLAEHGARGEIGGIEAAYGFEVRERRGMIVPRPEELGEFAMGAEVVGIDLQGALEAGAGGGGVSGVALQDGLHGPEVGGARQGLERGRDGGGGARGVTGLPPGGDERRVNGLGRRAGGEGGLVGAGGGGRLILTAQDDGAEAVHPPMGGIDRFHPGEDAGGAGAVARFGGFLEGHGEAGEVEAAGFEFALEGIVKRRVLAGPGGMPRGLGGGGIAAGFMQTGEQAVGGGPAGFGCHQVLETREGGIRFPAGEVVAGEGDGGVTVGDGAGGHRGVVGTGGVVAALLVAEVGELEAGDGVGRVLGQQVDEGAFLGDRIALKARPIESEVGAQFGIEVGGGGGRGVAGGGALKETVGVVEQAELAKVGGVLGGSECGGEGSGPGGEVGACGDGGYVTTGTTAGGERKQDEGERKQVGGAGHGAAARRARQSSDEVKWSHREHRGFTETMEKSLWLCLGAGAARRSSYAKATADEEAAALQREARRGRVWGEPARVENGERESLPGERSGRLCCRIRRDPVRPAAYQSKVDDRYHVRPWRMR